MKNFRNKKRSHSGLSISLFLLLSFLFLYCGTVFGQDSAQQQQKIRILRIFRSSPTSDYYLITVNPEDSHSKPVGYNLKEIFRLKYEITRVYISEDNRYLIIHNRIDKNGYKIIRYNLRTQEQKETKFEELQPLSYFDENYYLIARLNNEHSISYLLFDLRTSSVAETIYTYENRDVKLSLFRESYRNIYDRENGVLYFKPINIGDEDKNIKSDNLTYFVYEKSLSKLTPCPDWGNISQLYNGKIVIKTKIENWSDLNKGYKWFFYDYRNAGLESIVDYWAQNIRILPDGKMAVMVNSPKILTFTDMDVFPFIYPEIKSVTFDTVVLKNNNKILLKWKDKKLSRRYYQSALNTYLLTNEPVFDEKFRITGKELDRIIRGD